jgi:hypothetical protein
MDGWTDTQREREREWNEEILTIRLLCTHNFSFIIQCGKCEIENFFIPSRKIKNILQVIGRKQQQQQHGSNNKTLAGSESQSQSSICSTPGQSSAASNKVSSDWPDPPDIPICSTEDEAASLYSDSGERICINFAPLPSLN